MVTVNAGDWVKIAEEKLSSTATSIRVPASGGWGEYNSLMILIDARADGSNDHSPALTFNDETTGTKYSTVYQHNAGQTSSRTTENDQPKITHLYNESGGRPAFAHLHIINNSGYEKAIICNAVNTSTAGASNTPQFTSTVGKWEDTSTRITSLRLTNNSSSNNFGADTEIVVFGSQKGSAPADKSTITNVPVGSRYHETDTKKIFSRYYSSEFDSAPSWVEKGTGGFTSATTKTGLVAGGYNPEMNISDEYVGGVWSAGGTTSVSYTSGFCGGSASSGLRASGQLASGYTNSAERYTGGGIGSAGSGTWSNTGIGTISDARSSMGGASNKDNGITMGGQHPSNNGYNIWQTWNGTAWSNASTNMNRATRSGAGDGNTTQAFQAGGYNTTNNYNNKTETLAGTTWTDSGYTLANPDSDALTMINGMGGGSSTDAIVCLGDGKTACTFDGTANWTTIANQSTSINNGAVGGNSSLAFRTGGNITGGTYTKGTENYNGTTWDTGGSLAGVARGYFGAGFN